MRILLVEDDPMIGKTLQAALAAGRVYGRLGAGRRGRPSAAIDTADGAYALVLLDLGLPRKSGLDLLKEIRRAGNRVRVLVVTARDAVADRVAGLDAGADDYLVKPFSLDELGARMRALLRRDIAREDNVLRNGDLALDPVDAHRHAGGPTGRPVGARVRAARRAARASRAPRCRRRSSRSGSTAGARKSRATPSRCTSTTCARSSAPTRSARLRGVGYALALRRDARSIRRMLLGLAAARPRRASRCS